MKEYIYKITQNQSINRWKYSGIKKEPVKTTPQIIDGRVNLTEGYQEVEYPVRRDFLAQLSSIVFPKEIKYDYLYMGFENPRVEFSTFITTPHKISTYLRISLESLEKQTVEFLLTTCGRAVVWLNEEQVIDFQPYSRNHGSTQIINLNLQAGTNDLILYMDDLAERDVNYFTDLTLLTNTTLKASFPIDYDEENLSAAKSFLEGLYFKKDLFTTGELKINTDNDLFQKVNICYKDPVYIEDDKGVGGDITDFSRQGIEVSMNQGYFSLGDVADFDSSGLTKIYVGVKLPDESYLYKKLVFSVYDEEKLKIDLGGTLPERKRKALELFAQLDLADMNSALASLHLNGSLTTEVIKKLQPAFSMITSRGDCADFMFAPMLSFVKMKENELPTELKEKIKELAVNFRYWIDEPGNDVMWYFSENHSLLFHTCQYFAGALYPESEFTVSGRTGQEQYEIGKSRLVEWFNHFKCYGFSEWNSTTYLPIDLIGFFSLYNSAPDQEIRELAKEALDFTFKIMAINHHGKVMSSTFGRTYEHDLKAMRLGEISNLFAIAWNKGYFNYALRASTVFCLSDYEPPKEFLAYIDLSDNQELTANYIQGVNQVETYLYKCSDYSLAGGINYRSGEKGHQQHMMNISLGDDGTQLWLNNPGELMHSGENRPSYWAGNGILPAINQYKNVMNLSYDLEKATVKKVHLYLPFWQLTEVDLEDEHWVFIKKKDSYLAIYFSREYQIETVGDTRDREIFVLGDFHEIIVKCSSASEIGTFEHFKIMMKNTNVDGHALVDYQWGNVDFSEGRLRVNQQLVERKSSGELNPEISNRLKK